MAQEDFLLHLAGLVARRALLGTPARTCALLGYCGLASAGGRTITGDGDSCGDLRNTRNSANLGPRRIFLANLSGPSCIWPEKKRASSGTLRRADWSQA